MDVICPMCSAVLDPWSEAYRGILIVQMARLGAEIVELETSMLKEKKGIVSSIEPILRHTRYTYGEIRRILQTRWPEMFR